MTAINVYALLSDFRAYKTSPGTEFTTDSVDDGVIEIILVAVSRHIDEQTNRRFYPSVETHSFDIPDGTNDDRMLWLDDDMLALTSLTNGNDTTIASTEYVLLPANLSPKYALRLRAEHQMMFPGYRNNCPAHDPNSRNNIDCPAVFLTVSECEKSRLFLYLFLSALFLLL